MSLTSLFLSLVLFPLKPKPAPPPKDQSPNGPKTQRELELEDELQRATFALSYWRTSWHDLWAENERLRAEHQALTDLAFQQRARAAQTNCSPARSAFIAP